MFKIRGKCAGLRAKTVNVSGHLPPAYSGTLAWQTFERKRACLKCSRFANLDSPNTSGLDEGVSYTLLGKELCCKVPVDKSARREETAWIEFGDHEALFTLLGISGGCIVL